jgi:hypothetical protein
LDVRVLRSSVFGLYDEGTLFRLSGAVDLARDYFGWGLGVGIFHRSATPSSTRIGEATQSATRHVRSAGSATSDASRERRRPSITPRRTSLRRNARDAARPRAGPHVNIQLHYYFG